MSEPVIDPQAWDRLPSDLRFRFRLSVMRRWVWPVEVHRGLYPIMAPSDPFHWRVAAYGNSIFIGPFVFSWRSKP